MLPVEVQTLEQMRARFHLAVDEPVVTSEVEEGLRPAPSRDRRHVFDFKDGMRLVVSVDRVIDQDYLHASASGDEHYGDTVKGEGLEGMVEDVLLRLCAFMGRQPGESIQAFTTNGVLHIIFEDTNNEGFAPGGNGAAGSG